MIFRCLFINILVLLGLTCAYSQEISGTVNENDSLVKKVQYPRLTKAQTRYLQWIDKKNREFPFAVPAIAYNRYDGVQIGAAMVNLRQPVKNIDFTGAMLYGVKSKKVNGTAKVDYYLRPRKGVLSELKPGVRFQSFSYDDFDKPLKYYALQPELKATFRHRTEKLENLSHEVAFRHYSIFRQTAPIVSTIFDESKRYYANLLEYKLDFEHRNFPAWALFSLEQTRYFVKSSIELNSFIRYQLKEYNTGVHFRFFAGGFMWRNNDYRIGRHPEVGFQLNGQRGEADYLFDDYYFGRGEQEGFSSRQITRTDGFFKTVAPFTPTEYAASWLMAFNLKIDFPIRYVPLKLFVDMGYTHNNFFSNGTPLPVKKFQYDAGFMFSFFDEGFEIYFPLLYSKDYKTYYKANAPKFGQRVSFLLDLKKLELHKKIRDMKF